MIDSGLNHRHAPRLKSSGKTIETRMSDLPFVVISEDFIIRHSVVFFIFATSPLLHQRGNL
ncbi:hypothetical protein BN2497_1301 [Janthinobacterium sp. CG23_2]|nr:hypothetical protein BN2497_1301 [Janthinobacterium sp. CG23_2]CUU27048.1 hypothetical protein BN3177_1301 [Janthinobacterium sp. CG23_2]